MAESLINSIARLRVIEKKLLPKETVARLCQAASYEECLKILREAGYSSPEASDDADEIEAMTKARLTETYGLMMELLPGSSAHSAELFRMRHDMTNVKLLYKTRLVKGDIEGAKLDFGGIYPEAALKKAIASGDYSLLPKPIADALEELDVITYRDPAPQTVSRKLDSAYTAYARSSGNAFVKKYFSALADFTNLLAVVRKMPEESFLPAGEYPAERLTALRDAIENAPQKAPDIVRSALEPSRLKQAARRGFEEYLKTGRTAAIEKARDDYLIALASEGRNDIDTAAPILGYMLAREREAEVIRLILTAKRSAIPMSAVEERSLTLYG
ncbi:MAG: V-type ATPase subunit [Clostridiales bacterium]|nr:V-type ATPase subunit [Clostridiales bacterium]